MDINRLKRIIIRRFKRIIIARFFPGYKHKIFLNYVKLLKKNGYNICYNIYTIKDYNPKLKNILLAIESPEVVKTQGFIKPYMKFVAEISFGNYCNLSNYYCPRTLYATNDNYVELNPSVSYTIKTELVSFIYSERGEHSGQKFRYKVAKALELKVDLFGSGTGKFLKEKIDSLKDHMFQIVIENCKHPDYVSEKFFDCLKTNTVPIYWGGEESVLKMGFDPKGILFFDSVEELREIIRSKVSRESYKKVLPHIKKNLDRLTEIRKEANFNVVLSPVLLLAYYHTTKSYHGGKQDDISIHF